MYTDDKAKNKSLLLNVRATVLARACGHGEAQIFGDAFVSRYHDDEVKDIWKRINLSIEETLPTSQWCKGGGGGLGKGSGSSMSSVMANMGKTEANGGVKKMGPGVGSAKPESVIVSDGEQPVAGQKAGQNHRWTQEPSEVELRIEVDKLVNAKNVIIKFSAKHLKVSVAKDVVVDAVLGGNVIIDECTYTIQDNIVNESRDLIITLGKANAKNWDACYTLW